MFGKESCTYNCALVHFLLDIGWNPTNEFEKLLLVVIIFLIPISNVEKPCNIAYNSTNLPYIYLPH